MSLHRRPTPPRAGLWRPLLFVVGQGALAVALGLLFSLPGCVSTALPRQLVPRLELQARFALRRGPGRVAQFRQLRAVAIFGDRGFVPTQRTEAAWVSTQAGGAGAVLARCAQDPLCRAQLAELGDTPPLAAGTERP